VAALAGLLGRAEAHSRKGSGRHRGVGLLFFGFPGSFRLFFSCMGGFDLLSVRQAPTATRRPLAHSLDGVACRPLPIAHCPLPPLTNALRQDRLGLRAFRLPDLFREHGATERRPDPLRSAGGAIRHPSCLLARWGVGGIQPNVKEGAGGVRGQRVWAGSASPGVRLWGSGDGAEGSCGRDHSAVSPS